MVINPGLTQVFVNLMHNSAKFTDGGGRIHVSLEQDSHASIVRVRDNGRGMERNELRALFHSPSAITFSDRTSTKGYSIGLRLAKSIVELHRGTIEAISGGLGYGSTFIVRLPMLSESV